MDIKLSTDKAKPGEKCTIKVKTTEDSLVSLLAVDQSITLLGTGNDIDNSRVADEMKGYDTYGKHPDLEVTGIEDRYLDFGESNAFILTNALAGNSSCFNMRGSHIDTSKGMTIENEDESGIEGYETDEAHNPDNPRVRKNFPQTWIFEDYKANDGEFTLKKSVPDTITSFIVTGFAIHPDNGLAIAASKKITVVQEFFLKLFLPYSVRFGEILKVDVTVFNYITKTKKNMVNADVKMSINEEEFEFIDAKTEGSTCKITALDVEHQTKPVSVPKDGGASTFFLIRALVTGKIKIKVRATAAKQADEVEMDMLVEHEGMTKSDNKAILIDLRAKDNANFPFDLAFATEKVVHNSIVIEASVVGDMLGPALANIHTLM